MLVIVLLGSLGGFSTSVKAQGAGWMTFDLATFGESLASAALDFDQMQAYYEELTTYYDQVGRNGGSLSDVLGFLSDHNSLVDGYYSQYKSFQDTWGGGWDSSQMLGMVFNTAAEMDQFQSVQSLLSGGGSILSGGTEYSFAEIPGLSLSAYSDYRNNVEDLNQQQEEATTLEMANRVNAAKALQAASANSTVAEMHTATTNDLLVKSLQNDAATHKLAESDAALRLAEKREEDSNDAVVGGYNAARLGAWR